MKMKPLGMLSTFDQDFKQLSLISLINALSDSDIKWIYK